MERQSCNSNNNLGMNLIWRLALEHSVKYYMFPRRIFTVIVAHFSSCIYNSRCASARNAISCIKLPYCSLIKSKYKYKWNVLEENHQQLPAITTRKIHSPPVLFLSVSFYWGVEVCFNRFAFLWVCPHSIPNRWEKGKKATKTQRKRFYIIFFIGKAIKWKSIFYRTVDDELVSSNCYTLYVLCSLFFQNCTYTHVFPDLLKY